MLKILQARLQQYMNWELSDVQGGFREGRGTRGQIANICWIIEKARECQKNICFTDYAKASDYVGHNKQEATVRTRHGTSSKLEKEYVKAVYCHPVYLTSMQSMSCEMSGWKKHKLNQDMYIISTSDSRYIYCCCLVVSNSFQPHGMQHARLPCPSLSPGVFSDSYPWSWWCHQTISSSVIHSFFCPKSFTASMSFPMSWLFASGGQSTGASVSASVLPMNIQCWFPLGLTGLISLMSKRLSRVFSSTTVWKHQFFSAQPSL